jgi:hypothetical protein
MDNSFDEWLEYFFNAETFFYTDALLQAACQRGFPFFLMPGGITTGAVLQFRFDRRYVVHICINALAMLLMKDAIFIKKNKSRDAK